MAKQLVLSGNRVIAHGEECFLAMGGTVICPDSGRVYQNATVANIEGAIPTDIDEVGYEYHAGEFVPCAPYGKGSGNLAVVCNDDCKSIKDSGISSDNLGKTEIIDYIGTGTKEVSITASFPPVFAVVYMSKEMAGWERYRFLAMITPLGGFSVQADFPLNSTAVETTFTPLRSSVSENTLTWGEVHLHDSAKMALNIRNGNYRVIVFGRAQRCI